MTNDPTTARPQLLAGHTILIVDDDALTRSTLDRILTRHGCRTVMAANGREALDMLSEEINVILLDLFMPEMDGREFLARIQQDTEEHTVIVISVNDDLDPAIEMMRLGANDYIAKPFNPDEIVSRIRAAARSTSLRRENRALRQTLAEPRPSSAFVGSSPSAGMVTQTVQRLAQLDSTVMLTGESGVGKGLVARMIHRLGDRASKPFVTVNCTALPRDLVESELFGHERGAFTGALERRPGRIEMAHGGTLFLDEIGDMPLGLQPKLLTFLQERTFQRVGGGKDIPSDVRVIAATNHDLKERCAQGKFREDLYFRLNVLPLHIPPLRERTEDILPLAEFLLDRVATTRKSLPYSLDPAARDRLLSYFWPGNVRELENVMERCSAFCSGRVIQFGDLPPEVQVDSDDTEESRAAELAGRTLAEIERLAIEQTLVHCAGNKARAARLLGISEKSIYNKMSRLGVDRATGRPGACPSPPTAPL